MFKWMSESIKEKEDYGNDGCFGNLRIPSPIREAISDVIQAPKDEPYEVISQHIKNRGK